MRPDGVHRQEFTGTGPVILKVGPVSGAAFLDITMDQIFVSTVYPAPIIGLVDMCDTDIMVIP